jgi:hypothetical protein
MLLCVVECMSLEGGRRIEIGRVFMWVWLLIDPSSPTVLGHTLAMYAKNIERIIVLGRGAGAC